MPGGLTLLASTNALIPTPASGKVTIYFSTDLNAPAYKDDTGLVHTLIGSTGQVGPTGIQGPEGEQPDVILALPGPQGNPGVTGTAGPIGPMMAMEQGVDGEDGINVYNPIIPSLILLKTTGNQTINGGAATFVDVTGLTFPVQNGKSYAFIFHVVFQSAQINTGWKCSVNCPTGALDFFANNQTVANAAAGATTFLHRHNDTRDDMTLLTATVTANVDLCHTFQGRYVCTADGTFAVRFANELIANTDITVRQGSWGIVF
jgi:hypothetical protein